MRERGKLRGRERKIEGERDEDIGRERERERKIEGEIVRRK